MIEIGLGILVFVIAGAFASLMVIALNTGRNREVAEHEYCFSQRFSSSPGAD